jgi:hypothetical protein
MHAVTKLAAVLGVTGASVVLATSPAGAEIGDGVNPPTNGEYSHAAAFVAGANHGGGSTGPATCVLDKKSDPALQAMPAHLEWNSYMEADGTYSVWLNCVADGHDVPSDRSLGFPDFDLWQVNWFTYGVVPEDPQEMAEDVISRLRPANAGIHTNPGAGQPSLVGIPTWLWLDEQAYGPQERTETDGPMVGGQPLMAVTVRAWPKEGGSVVWDTGDGSVTCPGSGLPAGSCTYEYTRSSHGQQATDDAGNPAFTITASYFYEGSYEVRVMGEVIDSGLLGDMEVTSSTVLAVNEAQAINTGSGG